MSDNNLVIQVERLEGGVEQLETQDAKNQQSISNIEKEIYMLAEKTEQNRQSNVATAKIAQETHKFLLETKSEFKGGLKVFKWLVIPMSTVVLPIIWAFINSLFS